MHALIIRVMGGATKITLCDQTYLKFLYLGRGLAGLYTSAVPLMSSPPLDKTKKVPGVRTCGLRKTHVAAGQHRCSHFSVKQRAEFRGSEEIFSLARRAGTELMAVPSFAEFVA